MWISNPIALYGWIIVTVILFSSLSPQKALILSVLGSFLFLPMSSLDLPIPFMPALNKGTSVAYGILLGEIISGVKSKAPMKFGLLDVPMVFYCFLSPIASSVSNGLGLYDGLSSSMNRFISWGVVYWAGRRYFRTAESLRSLVYSMMIGGLICVPMVLFEVRMSPQLHTMVYGFFQHSFVQHYRQGGYRPILFMQHGLMVALWMSVSTVIAFWNWWVIQHERSQRLKCLVFFLSLAGATVLCKSSGALVLMMLGIAMVYFYKKAQFIVLLKWVLLIIPIYIFLRLSNIIKISQIQELVARIFEEERVQSLFVRLLQEDLFGKRALVRPLFGWGWMSRAWPTNFETGEMAIQMVDSLWIILFSTSGLIGLVSFYLSIGDGPLRLFKRISTINRSVINTSEFGTADAVILSIVLSMFLLDSLQNAMVAQIYIVCAGALLGYFQALSDDLLEGRGPFPVNTELVTSKV